MPFLIVRNDITKMNVDAIVNAANNSLLGGGGVDGAIHRAAGPQLLEECRTLGGCATGDAKITKGYNLPAKYVIHTVGPVWEGGGYNKKELLTSCYRKSLELAKEYGCETVAFPLISAGAYGYPKDQALRVAIDAITGFLSRNDMLVYIVIFDKDSFRISEKLVADIRQFIDDRYVDEHSNVENERVRKETFSRVSDVGLDVSEDILYYEDIEEANRNNPDYVEPTVTYRDIPLGSIEGVKRFQESQESSAHIKSSVERIESVKTFEDTDYLDDVMRILRRNSGTQFLPLGDYVKDLDESFSEMLLRKISEKGMKDSECYKKANIDRKLFSKIKNDKLYKPSKPTAIAFAIALELSLGETEELLRKAGFALSHSSKFDIIIEYFIVNENYNIFDINDALFEFDQPLLGC
ncbi:MAG: O-acetyl-ADP-ribose deacetylase [Oscillospiraceae bacterium]|nr:O-acetyl-ADP-ribose deacetylase [Oscillospiraceae bacterium]